MTTRIFLSPAWSVETARTRAASASVKRKFIRTAESLSEGKTADEFEWIIAKAGRNANKNGERRRGKSRGGMRWASRPGRLRDTARRRFAEENLTSPIPSA